jgi:glycosyltransferase involved in cell wall biosynthesis
MAQQSARIHAWFRYVPDAEVQCFMNACDVCVLPYHEVTTSGAAILAFSFGRPIIAPALGAFPELAADGRGIIYDPHAEGSLLEALQEARDVDMIEGGGKALSWAKEHQWRTLAPQFVRIYGEALGTRS